MIRNHVQFDIYVLLAGGERAPQFGQTLIREKSPPGIARGGLSYRAISSEAEYIASRGDPSGCAQQRDVERHPSRQDVVAATPFSLEHVS